MRETVESVVIAIVLAFLFRTFVAEPFVIPTGSMAPTLQGRHQHVTCPICDFSYRAGASHEVDNGIRRGTNYLGVCPQCGFIGCTNPEVAKKLDRYLHQANEDPIFSKLTLDLAKETSSSGGDRILVSKSAYEFDEPHRWDIFVFHFPGDASKNYIKRLVGLPGETLRIKHGDVFRSPDVTANDNTPQDDFFILRKPADAVLKMRQLVYDNDYAAAPGVVEFMTNRNWPTRWFGSEGGWQSQDYTKSFEVDDQAEPVWLRYRHVLASLDDWNRLLEEETSAVPQPQLVTDGYAYNSGAFALGMRDRSFKPLAPAGPGMNWTGDLIVECQIESLADQGKVILELVEGGIRFQCELDLQAGKATLEIVDPQDKRLAFEARGSELPSESPQASIPMQGKGSHQVTFANVDDQLHLWIDGESVVFDSPTSYPRLGNISPTRDDLLPVGIAAVGAKLRVDQLRLYRDVYYIASHGRNQSYCDLKYSRLNDYMRETNFEDFASSAALVRKRARFFSQPSEWGNAYLDPHELTFSLQKFDDDRYQDQFFALGDNSPHSQDSRLWWTVQGGIGHYVERKLIIGRAMLIYWPLGNVRFIQ